MIGVNIECRLGNQLFQYAFIKALSHKLNTPFFVNDKFEKFIIPDLFDLPESYTYQNKLKRLYFKLRFGLLKRLNAVPFTNYTDEAFNLLADNTIYSGYFQSALYFNTVLNDIINNIKVKSKYHEIFNKSYGASLSGQPIVAVHVRRGDYLNLNNWWAENLGSNDLTLPASYYLNCLSQIKNIRDYKIIFVSDDIQFCQKTFAHIDNAEFAGSDMMTDFQILMNADIAIISNSSFAWWAVLLNSKKNKKIFCPKYWLGFKIGKEYPAEIIYPGWIQVDVNHNYKNGIN